MGESRNPKNNRSLITDCLTPVRLEQVNLEAFRHYMSIDSVNSMDGKSVMLLVSADLSETFRKKLGTRHQLSRALGSKCFQVSSSDLAKTLEWI